MEVKIIRFPATKVAAIEHRGSPHLEHVTALKLVEWRMKHRMHPDHHRSYGIHYDDPNGVSPENYRVDFCVSVECDVAENTEGIVNKIIPEGRCAVVRHYGSRDNVSAAPYLYEVWFPKSGEVLGDFPIFFHYINVGPNVKESEMLTDVYLPLR